MCFAIYREVDEAPDPNAPPAAQVSGLSAGLGTGQQVAGALSTAQFFGPSASLGSAQATAPTSSDPQAGQFVVPANPSQPTGGAGAAPPGLGTDAIPKTTTPGFVQVTGGSVPFLIPATNKPGIPLSQSQG